MSLQIRPLCVDIDRDCAVVIRVEHVARELLVVVVDGGDQRLLMVVIIDDLADILARKRRADVVPVQVDALDNLDLGHVLALVLRVGGEGVDPAPNLVCAVVVDDHELALVDARIRVVRDGCGRDVRQLIVRAAAA